MQKPTSFIFLKLALPVVLVALLLQNCQKDTETTADTGELVAASKKKNPPPPPPQPFYFNGCSDPATVPHFVAGVPASISFTMLYVNSPGGSYAAFTSSTVNGITVTAPAGILNVGSGSITFTASGTPVSSGLSIIPMSIAGSVPCSLYVTTINAPPAGGNCSDPGSTFGSTGCVTFTYQGQTVTYQTVRAKDGKVWIQHNLGSPQVAWNAFDNASYGHYFQWGRWDDGHQVTSSSVVTHSTDLNDPSHIAGGLSSFIKNSSTTAGWWNTGTSADSWNGTSISSTNGKDPCTALGPGWRLPTQSDWQNIIITEDVFNYYSGFNSNLKLTATGYRLNFNGTLYDNWAGANYWSSTPGNNGQAVQFFFDDGYDPLIQAAPRGYGFPCRCVKD